MSAEPQPYLLPYLRAAERCGDGFGALLWASPRTQKTRFDAIRNAYDPTGKSLLDVGCGRADYLAFLIESRIIPADYIGIEMVQPLVVAAQKNARDAGDQVSAKILQADFVSQPVRLFVGADVVMFSGSLNTLAPSEFYSTLERAYEATSEALVFNFLCSPYLAGRQYLTWHETEDVRRFARKLTPRVEVHNEYLRGDCTMCLLH